MYSDETAAQAIATLAILLHDTPLEDTHPDLAAQVNKVLHQAEDEAYEFAAHMGATAPDSPVYETSTITVNETRKYVLQPDLMYDPYDSKGENHD